MEKAEPKYNSGYVYFRFYGVWGKYFMHEARWESPRLGEPCVWQHRLTYFSDDGKPCCSINYSEGELAQEVEAGELILTEKEFRKFISDIKANNAKDKAEYIFQAKMEAEKKWDNLVKEEDEMFDSILSKVCNLPSE